MSIHVFPTAPSPTVTHLMNFEALIFVFVFIFLSNVTTVVRYIWEMARSLSTKEASNMHFINKPKQKKKVWFLYNFSCLKRVKGKKRTVFG